MELLFIGINIALLFGSIGGLIAILALPFLASMIVKNRNRLDEIIKTNKVNSDLERQFRGDLRRQLDVVESNLKQGARKFNANVEAYDSEFKKLQRQVDSIESDLEQSKLSSLTKSAQPAKLSNKPKVNSSAIKAKNIQDSVLHLANKKQGGKRANKSRNK
jgi:hypothetical protein